MVQTNDRESSGRLAALSHEVAFQGFHLVLSLIFTLPLVADWVANGLGWRIFFLADPHIQLVWATVVQVGGGWPYYARLGRERGARRAASLTVAVLSGGLYLYGVFLTFARPAVVTHPFFQAGACMIALVTLRRFISAVLERRFARRQAR